SRTKVCPGRCIPTVAKPCWHHAPKCTISAASARSETHIRGAPAHRLVSDRGRRSAFASGALHSSWAHQPVRHTALPDDDSRVAGRSGAAIRELCWGGDSVDKHEHLGPWRSEEHTSELQSPYD